MDASQYEELARSYALLAAEHEQAGNVRVAAYWRTREYIARQQARCAAGGAS